MKVWRLGALGAFKGPAAGVLSRCVSDTWSRSHQANPGVSRASEGELAIILIMFLYTGEDADAKSCCGI